MKKSVTATVLACALVVGGVGLTPAGAAESSADVCYSVSIDKSSIVAADTRTEMIGFKELSTQAVDPAVLSESKGGSMTRATSRIEWDIPSGKIMKADTAYSLEADEVVTITARTPPGQQTLTSGSSPRIIRSILPAGVRAVSKPISRSRIQESIILRYEIILKIASRYWDMSTIKWKIIPILLITAYLLLGCIGCSSYSSEEKDATDLTGDTLKPSNIGEISFDISEIGNMPLMTEFYICPANGTIEIKYAEGAWSNLKVDLYDIEYEESIQTGENRKCRR